MTSTVRPLFTIAAEIAATWGEGSFKGPKIYFGAVPYLDAMNYLNLMSDRFGHDSADDIVMYFLSNAKTWRGDDARRIKAELKSMLADHAQGDQAMSTYDAIERADEALLTAGFSWREASSITNEGISPAYTIAGRVQLAVDSSLPRCTGCEKEASDLVPWSGERLCWDCMDTQLDLIAKAVSEELSIPVLTRLTDLDCAWLAGHLTDTEHDQLLLLASRSPRVKEALR